MIVPLCHTVMPCGGLAKPLLDEDEHKEDVAGFLKNGLVEVRQFLDTHEACGLACLSLSL